MINFEIKNAVLTKIKVENGVERQPVNGVIKIPSTATEIAENVLDNSIVGDGHQGYDYFHFSGILIPKSVTKISPNAFNSIKIDKEVIFENGEKHQLNLDSEKMVLFFEDEQQKELAKSLNNPSSFEKDVPTIFHLSENNPNIDVWLFGKISSTLKLSRIDDKIIEFKNRAVVVSITHSNYIISSIIIDNGFYGYRGIDNEDTSTSEGTYIFNPNTDKLNERRVRELFD